MSDRRLSVTPASVSFGILDKVGALISKERGRSSETLNQTPKGDQSGRGSSFI